MKQPYLVLLLMAFIVVSVMAQSPTPTPVPADPPPAALTPSRGTAAPGARSGTISISPNNPTAVWPATSGSVNRLSPAQTATITVDVADSGDANGASYQLREMNVTTSCGAPYVLWTPESGSENRDYKITNTAGDSVEACLMVSATWEPVSNAGSSGTGSDVSKDIPGFGIANLQLLKSVVCWNLPNPPDHVVVGGGTASGEFNAYIIDEDGWPIVAASADVIGTNYNPSGALWEVDYTASDEEVIAGGKKLSMTVVSGTVSTTEWSKGNLMLLYKAGAAQSATSPMLTFGPAKFAAQEGMMWHGFDPIPTDTQDNTPWASVTAGKSTGHVIFKTVASVASQMELEVTTGSGSLSVSPATPSGSETPLTLTASGAVDAKVIAKFTASDTEVTSLNVVILPQREVTIAIYRLYDSTSFNTMPVDGPSDSDVIQTLNAVFKQAGISFSLVTSSTINFPFDRDKDGICSRDEWAVIPSTEFTGKGNINIVYVKDQNIGGAALALNTNAACGSGALISLEKSAAKYNDLTLVVAHEVGHKFDLPVVGVWSEGGVHDMVTDPERSLMHSGQGVDSPGRWLRKVDWVEANKNYNKIE